MSSNPSAKYKMVIFFKLICIEIVRIWPVLNRKVEGSSPTHLLLNGKRSISQ